MECLHVVAIIVNSPIEFKVVIMAARVVRGVRGSSRGASENSWGTHAGETKTVQSTNPTEIGVSTVDSRSAWLWA